MFIGVRMNDVGLLVGRRLKMSYGDCERETENMRMKDKPRIHADESSKTTNGQLLVGPAVKINLTALKCRLCHVRQRSQNAPFEP